MAKLQTPSRRLNFAKSILIGVVILAVAAIIIAWMDVAGVGQVIVQVLEKAKQ